MYNFKVFWNKQSRIVMSFIVVRYSVIKRLINNFWNVESNANT